MTDAILLRTDAGAITTLTMNTPGTLNALSDAMLAALKSAFADLMHSETCRVIILKGAGKAFCAGHNLKEMQAKRAAPDGGAASLRNLFDRCTEVMLMIPRLPQPVIAQAPDRVARKNRRSSS